MYFVAVQLQKRDDIAMIKYDSCVVSYKAHSIQADNFSEYISNCIK